jgi:hypothetical protein
MTMLPEPFALTFAFWMKIQENAPAVALCSAYPMSAIALRLPTNVFNLNG